MDELVAAGARLRAAAPTPAPRFERVTEHARRHQRKRRVQGAIAGTLAVALATIGVWAGVRSTNTTVRIQGPTTTPHTAALSPQMRAHLGLDAPKGWVPYDVGTARVWVPSRSTLSCDPGGRCPAHTILVPKSSAGAGDAYVSLRTPDPLADTPHPSLLNMTLVAPINGYQVYESSETSVSAAADANRLILRTFFVPVLQATITISEGASGDRILHTLGPSALEVVRTTRALVSTINWRTVSFHDRSVRVPPGWHVFDATGRMQPCHDTKTQTVVVGTYAGAPGCPFAPSAVTDELPDRGLIEYGANPSTLPTRRVAIAGRAVEIVSGITGNVVVIAIGGRAAFDLVPGRDGRIDAAILASVRAVSP